MDKDEALQKYIEGMGVSQNQHYVRIASEFLRHATELDRENIVRYTKRKQKEGYSAGSIELFQRTIRALYRRNGAVWPLKRGENASVPANEERILALSSATVKQLIDGAMHGKLNILQAFYLALSTVYGLRRTEIARVRMPHINLESRSFYAQTAKGGRDRYHRIPEEILPIFRGACPYLETVSPYKVSEAFPEIEKACGVAHIADTGWHSIRHSLEYHLIENGLTELTVREFMRWGKRSRTDMVSRYHDVQFVGVDGAELGRAGAQDEQVFEKHPFLPFWRMKP